MGHQPPKPTRAPKCIWELKPQHKRAQTSRRGGTEDPEGLSGRDPGVTCGQPAREAQARLTAKREPSCIPYRL